MLELPSKGMKDSSSEMRTESALQKMHAPVVSWLPASAKPGSSALCRELGSLPILQLRPPQAVAVAEQRGLRLAWYLAHQLDSGNSSMTQGASSCKSDGGSTMSGQASGIVCRT